MYLFECRVPKRRDKVYAAYERVSSGAFDNQLRRYRIYFPFFFLYNSRFVAAGEVDPSASCDENSEARFHIPTKESILHNLFYCNFFPPCVAPLPPLPTLRRLKPRPLLLELLFLSLFPARLRTARIKTIRINHAPFRVRDQLQTAFESIINIEMERPEPQSIVSLVGKQ